MRRREGRRAAVTTPGKMARCILQDCSMPQVGHTSPLIGLLGASDGGRQPGSDLLDGPSGEHFGIPRIHLRFVMSEWGVVATDPRLK